MCACPSESECVHPSLSLCASAVPLHSYVSALLFDECPMARVVTGSLPQPSSGERS